MPQTDLLQQRSPVTVPPSNLVSSLELFVKVDCMARWLILYISGNMMQKWGKEKDSDTNQITKFTANVHNILN